MADTNVSVEQYLATSYRPDCDYINGEVRERLWGDGCHAAVQSSLCGILGTNYKAWNIRLLISQRFRLSAHHYRVADISALPQNAPLVAYPDTPPVFCIEVLEPQDRFESVLERALVFSHFGIKAVWMIHSRTREIWSVDASGPKRFNGEALVVPGTPIRIPIPEIFTLIDEAPRE